MLCTYCIIIICILLIVAFNKNECQKINNYLYHSNCYCKYNKECYGPPPGLKRAVDHNDLPDDRGWIGLDNVYQGSSASSIAHMIKRSA